MSTVMEIEAAIERLPAAEQLRLWERLAERARPKTGAELAKLWPARFHLSTAEADEFARDLEKMRSTQTRPTAPAWE